MSVRRTDLALRFVAANNAVVTVITVLGTRRTNLSTTVMMAVSVVLPSRAFTVSVNTGVLTDHIGVIGIVVSFPTTVGICGLIVYFIRISLSSKGTYLVQIVSDDGTLISSYKYTKNDPINKTTQIVLICVAIGAVILVAVFFLVRRKGKYR